MVRFTVELDFSVKYNKSVKKKNGSHFNLKQRHLERRVSTFYISYACLPISMKQNQPNSSTVNVLTCCSTSPLRSGWIEPEISWWNTRSYSEMWMIHTFTTTNWGHQGSFSFHPKCSLTPEHIGDGVVDGPQFIWCFCSSFKWMIAFFCLFVY